MAQNTNSTGNNQTLAFSSFFSVPLLFSSSLVERAQCRSFSKNSWCVPRCRVGFSDFKL